MRTLALTCRRFREFAQKDTSWKNLTRRGWTRRPDIIMDIIMVPLEKDLAVPQASWFRFYKQRLLSHLPSLSYLIAQQNLTVTMR